MNFLIGGHFSFNILGSQLTLKVQIETIVTFVVSSWLPANHSFQPITDSLLAESYPNRSDCELWPEHLAWSCRRSCSRSLPWFRGTPLSLLSVLAELRLRNWVFNSPLLLKANHAPSSILLSSASSGTPGSLVGMRGQILMWKLSLCP